jgi:hypothetical protein
MRVDIACLWIDNNSLDDLIQGSGGYNEISSILADQCSQMWGRGEVAGSQLMSTVQLHTGPQINFGDLTPYLTYGYILTY